MIKTGNPRVTLKIKAVPFSRDELKVCKDRSGKKINSNICDCNDNSNLGDAIDCNGDLNQNGKPDQGERLYCYKQTSGYKCEETPACSTGLTKNNDACDCNLDGQAQGNCNYCIVGDTENTCSSTSPSDTQLDREKPIINGLSFVQGDTTTQIRFDSSETYTISTATDVRFLASVRDNLDKNIQVSLRVKGDTTDFITLIPPASGESYASPYTRKFQLAKEAQEFEIIAKDDAGNVQVKGGFRLRSL